MGTLGKTPGVLGIAPEEHSGRATIPQPPVYLVALGIAKQIRVAVPAVELVLPVDVRGMEGKAHLLHPVLGGDPQVHACLQASLDYGIRQPLGAGVETDLWRLLLHQLENVTPELFLLFPLQARLVVHSELDSIDVRHSAQELR